MWLLLLLLSVICTSGFRAGYVSKDDQFQHQHESGQSNVFKLIHDVSRFQKVRFQWKLWIELVLNCLTICQFSEKPVKHLEQQICLFCWGCWILSWRTFLFMRDRAANTVLCCLLQGKWNSELQCFAFPKAAIGNSQKKLKHFTFFCVFTERERRSQWLHNKCRMHSCLTSSPLECVNCE